MFTSTRRRTLTRCSRVDYSTAMPSSTLDLIRTHIAHNLQRFGPGTVEDNGRTIQVTLKNGRKFVITVEESKPAPSEKPMLPPTLPPFYVGALANHYNFHSRTNPMDNCGVGSCKDAVRRYKKGMYEQ